MSPKVFVVLVNWKRPAETLDCLASLRSVEHPDFQVVVVDNASGDDAVASIQRQFSKVTLLQNSRNLGYAEGNNVGIRYALKHGAEFVLLLNNDTIVDKKLLSDLIEAAQADSTIGILSPAIYDYQNPTKIWFAGATIDWASGDSPHTGLGQEDNGQFQKTVEVDRVCGCAMMVRRELFEKVGLLDADYFLYYEDVDLCVRATQAGYRSVCVQSAKVWHKESSTTGAGQGSAMHGYYHSRNKLLFLKKHGRLGRAKDEESREFCRAYMRHVIRHPFDRVFREAQAPVFSGIRDFYRHRVGIKDKLHR